MARFTDCFVLYSAVLLLVSVSPTDGSSERTTTVEFDVKPGGVAHSFSQTMGDHECTFTYVSQGGTNEQWMMSVGLSEDDKLFFCSVWRPQGKSYLFFTQFKAELKGTEIKHVNAYSQTAAGGQKNVFLPAEEYIIDRSTVTHNEGKFNAQLSKLTVIGRTLHDEL
ncbi:myeloid-derived growth factor [Gouania willdenowi]|uniref:Myeloid-derived growth factor n=1 Tax=Gouania willdenowi TaxID=441366 RepID=A0A8C5I9Q9_GOUWI|nr:myeloid-derived growth factor [Gouania willdenowi]